jgi:hypothetical protein
MSKKVKRGEPGAVRGRVERHLKRLLIPGVMSLGACKATKVDSVVCDPMPPPVDANAGAGDAGEVVPTSGGDAFPPSVVCDPMPAPIDAGKAWRQRVRPSRDRTIPPSVVCDPMPPPQLNDKEPSDK